MREIRVTNADTAEEDEVAACLSAVMNFLEQETSDKLSLTDQACGWQQASLLEGTGAHKIRAIGDRKTWADGRRCQHGWRQRIWAVPLLVASSLLCAHSSFAQTNGQDATAVLAPPVLSRPPLTQIATNPGAPLPGRPSSESLTMPEPDAYSSPSSDLRQADVGSSSTQPLVRVLLAGKTSVVHVGAPSGAQLVDQVINRPLADLPPQSQWMIRAAGPVLTFSANNSGHYSTYRSVSYTPACSAPDTVALPPQHLNLPSGRVYAIVPPADEAVLELDGKPYRGALVVRARGDASFDVINYVNLEWYVKSVVACEMPSGWPLEALKAQAIAARSFAAANAAKHESEGYDVTAGIEDQVYKGASAETASSVAATDETRGEVLRYQGKVVSAFFHSGSGGQTELAENVWGRPVPYLKAVADYDDESPYFSWSRSFTADQTEQALAASGKSVGALLALMPIARGVSPRVRWILVSGTERSVLLTGEQARKIFGLPSACFNVVGSDNSYVFAGRGNGHGLGMSQWGAKRLAEAGMSASDILNYYFKDVTAEQL